VANTSADMNLLTIVKTYFCRYRDRYGNPADGINGLDDFVITHRKQDPAGIMPL